MFTIFGEVYSIYHNSLKPLAMLLVSLCPPEGPHLFGIVACLPFFLAGVTVGGVGGGDVKLMGACGVVLGFRQTFGTYLGLAGLTAKIPCLRRKRYNPGMEREYPRCINLTQKTTRPASKLRRRMSIMSLISSGVC